MAALQDLNNLPKTTNSNLWCDFIELHCLVNENGRVTPNDIFDIISDDEISEDNLADVVEAFEEDTLSLDFLINFGEEEADDLTDAVGNNTSKIKDDLIKKIEDHFLFLAYRADLFGEKYPYIIDLDNSSISLKSEINLDNRLYFILLISSNLQYCNDSIAFLTGNFEFYSLEVVKNILPEESEIYIYGKNNIGYETPFTGKEIDKLKILSERLNIPLGSNATDSFISKYSTGDTGLDIVGWYNFIDEKSSSVKLFAQCACGKEWINKQFEVSTVKWSNYFQFLNDPLSMILIPRSFRNENGDWENPLKIYNTIVVDRLRLLTTMPTEKNAEVFDVYRVFLKEIMSNTIDNFD